MDAGIAGEKRPLVYWCGRTWVISQGNVSRALRVGDVDEKGALMSWRRRVRSKGTHSIIKFVVMGKRAGRWGDEDA
jgi:hypothetical protein